MAENMTRKEALDWKHGFEAAREAERSLIRREPVNVGRSVRLALALIEICGRRGIFPSGVPGSERERFELAARERWAGLKRALRP
jgi:hypothetical protein